MNLNGGLAYSAPNAYQVYAAAVTVNGTSTIDVTSSGGVGSAGLYLDGGLKGGSPVTVTSHTNGLGLVLRGNSNTYNGTLTVNGTASATPGAGSGLGVGNTVGASMANASITVNGTLEMGFGIANSMNWALVSDSGMTFSMDALAGSGVVVSNMNTVASTRTISVGNNGGGGTFSGVIADGTNDTLSFTKAGSGTQILSGANTYTGVTTISGGVLSVATIGNGGVASGNLGSATSAAGNLVFNGGTLQYTGSTATSDRAFTINASKTATIDVTNGLSLPGATGAATNGTLTKIGAGTLTLTGVSTYTGATTITGGTLRLGDGTTGHDGSLATSGVTDTAGLAYNLFGNQSVGYPISGTGGTLTKTGAGTLTLSGANTYSGATSITGGALNVTGTLANTSGVTIGSGAVLTGSGNNSTTGLIGNLVSNSAGGGAINLVGGRQHQVLDNERPDAGHHRQLWSRPVHHPNLRDRRRRSRSPERRHGRQPDRHPDGQQLAADLSRSPAVRSRARTRWPILAAHRPALRTSPSAAPCPA